MRAAVWLAVDGVVPSNKEQGYVLRRLVRRAIRFAFDLGIEKDLCEKVAPIVVEIFAPDFPEVREHQKQVIEVFTREERIFRQTLRNGLREFNRLEKLGFEKGGEISEKMEASEVKANKPVEFHRPVQGPLLTGKDIFRLYDTYGFPVELSLEEARRQRINIDKNWKKDFDSEMAEQRYRSQTASVGMFKGGLADHSPEVIKLHTTTHLMYQALKKVLGDHIVQRGSNITTERTRFDFSHPQKVAPEEIKKVEDIVNQKITEDLSVTWKEEKTKDALKTASGAFGDKYGDTVKVYTIGDPAKPFSREICGGPHVEHTGAIGEGGKKFKIIKEEASSAGVRRIKAVLQ
jgi:alanyl-tRNA synthetase